MSDYDNWKNGITDMFGKPLEDNAQDPAQDLAMSLFGKRQEELSDDEYREYLVQVALLEEDVL